MEDLTTTLSVCQMKQEVTVNVLQSVADIKVLEDTTTQMSRQQRSGKGQIIPVPWLNSFIHTIILLAHCSHYCPVTVVIHAKLTMSMSCQKATDKKHVFSVEI